MCKRMPEQDIINSTGIMSNSITITLSQRKLNGHQEKHESPYTIYDTNVASAP